MDLPGDVSVRRLKPSALDDRANGIGELAPFGSEEPLRPTVSPAPGSRTTSLLTGQMAGIGRLATASSGPVVGWMSLRALLGHPSRS